VTDTSAFRKTLRELAEADDRADRLRTANLLASQLEVAFNQQGNLAQVAIWDVQEAAYQKIDDLHKQVGDTNTLLAGVIEAIHGLRGDVRQSATESAARLKKIEARLDTKRERLDDHEQRLKRIEQRLGFDSDGA